MVNTEDQSFFPEGVESTLFPVNRARYQVLTRLLESLPITKGKVLEIGSFLGQSALLWSEVLARHCAFGGSVLCVDPWRPFLSGEDIHAGPLYRQTQASMEDGAAFEQFKRNISAAPLGAPITFFRGTLEELVKTRHPTPFDLVYIDGSHYYQDVKKDLLLAQPLVRVGGILCGDDLEMQLPEVDEEVCRRECDRQRDFIDYHPGVTLAVWEEFGAVWVEHGAWAMRRVSGRDWKAPF